MFHFNLKLEHAGRNVSILTGLKNKKCLNNLPLVLDKSIITFHKEEIVFIVENFAIGIYFLFLHLNVSFIKSKKYHYNSIEPYNIVIDVTSLIFENDGKNSRTTI